MNVYKVTFGAVHKEGYDRNVSSYKILAKDGLEAIDKADSKAYSEEGYVEVFESVEYILTIDVD